MIASFNSSNFLNGLSCMCYILAFFRSLVESTGIEEEVSFDVSSNPIQLLILELVRSSSAS